MRGGRAARSVGAVGLAALSAVILGVDLLAQSQEVVVGVRVHGNTVTSSEEIEDALRASGLVVGEPFSDDVLDRAADGLRDTGDFERVELLKRFASIADPTLILVVVLVDEGPVRIVMDTDSDEAPRVVRRGIANVMFMPVLGFEDGYGPSYGVRFSINDVAGGHSRMSFPLTWGGHKRAGVEVQKDFEWPGAPRVSAGAVVDRRTHPFYGEDADGRRVWARTEWQPAGAIRTGATVAWQRVSLVDERLSGPSAGVDFVLDTRLDAVLPRNAVFARAAIEHFGLENSAFTQSELEARGYIGAVGQSVLVVRALREDSSTSKPAFYQSMLGGNSSLRGFPAGSEVGDTLVAGSAELRVPLTSPLNLARFGVNVFADVATIYDTGERLRDQRWSTGFGGGIWAGAAVFQFSLVVAHGIDQGTRVHLGFGTGF